MPRLREAASRSTDVAACRRASPVPQLEATIDVPAGAQDAGDLGEERRHVELGDEVEGVVVVRAGRAASATLKATRPSGSRPTLRRGRADHLLGDVDPADPRLRELAGEEERALAGRRSRSRGPARARA